MANEHLHRKFVALFGNIGSHYLSHTLGHLRIGTTKSDKGDRGVEDIVSVTDLAAGAICEVMSSYYREGMLPKHSSGLILPPANGMSHKGKTILDWFSGNQASLKRLVIGLEAGDEPRKILVRHYNFHGTGMIAKL